MPRYQFKASHKLSKEQVREKVEVFSENYDASTEWKGRDECFFSGQYKGISVSGTVKIYDNEVDVSLNLPLVAVPFKSKLKEEVVKELS